MGLRTKACLIGACLTLFSSLATALGLGEIKLNTALNQPLNAEIPLLEASGFAEGDILVSIATPEEFARSGVERSYFLAELKLSLDLVNAKGPVIRIVSQSPVTEPFLNFIVATQWPSGRILREYTLLLDLPVFSGATSTPVQAAARNTVETSPQPAAKPSTPRPVARTPAPTYKPKPAPEAEPTAEPKPEASAEPSYSSDTYGPVGAKDTLWSIASKVKNSSASVQQVMLAIQRLNPDAFINNNINLLKRGQVLRIPDDQEIQNISASQAAQDVADQHKRWSKRSATEESNSEAQLEGSKKYDRTRKESASVEGRVKLVSPQAGDKKGRGTGDGSGKEGSAVEDTLAQTQEELDAAGKENTDLKSRINAMEEQIDTMEKLVEVSSEELHALEVGAKQVNQANQTEGTQAPTEAQPTSAETKPAETKPAVKPVQPKPSSFQVWLDRLKANLLFVGIGVGALILALAAFLYMRNRNDGFSDDDFERPIKEDARRSFAVEDDHQDNDNTVPLFDSALTHQDDDIDYPVEAETEDVVGECDIHIAYGQYDQAEEKLARALERDPENTAVRLKLMEVYAAQKNGPAFDRHYGRLHAMGDSDVLDRATMLRDAIPGIGAFVAATEAFADDEPADSLAFDEPLSFDFDESVEQDKPESWTDSDADFELNLDDDADDITRIPPPKSADPSFDADLADLDFALDDGIGAVKDDFALAETDMVEPNAADSATTQYAELGEDPGFDEFDLDFDDLEAQRSVSEESFDLDLSDPLLADTQNSTLAADTLESDYAQLSESLLEDTEAYELPTPATPELSISPALDSSETDTEISARDFDLDFDLNTGVNLDALDHELDVLAADTLSDIDSLEVPGVETQLELPETLLADDTVTDTKDLLDHGLDLSEDSSDFTKVTDPVDFGDTDDFADFGDLGDIGGDTIADADDHDLTDDLLTSADLTLQEPEEVEMEEPLIHFDDLDLLSDKQPAAEVHELQDDLNIPDFDPENDDDSNLDFLSDNDETATKLDLARAYIDMGDADGAKDILDEIMEEGNDQQKKDAEVLLAKIG
jgi:pilus assembly protein FimV